MKSTRGTDKRRALLQAAVRWPLAGSLALVAARLLGYFGGGQAAPEESCVSGGPCGACRALPACRLPQAELFRRGACSGPGEPPGGAAPAGGRVPDCEPPGGRDASGGVSPGRRIP